MATSTREQRIARLRRIIGTNMRRIRTEKGLTQEQAAAQGGLSWRHYQAIEAGKINVTLSTITKIAMGLDVDPAELLKSTEH